MSGNTALSEAADAAGSLLRDGYARVQLPPEMAGNLRNALSESRSFFDRDEADKLRHASSDLNHGFRPMGKEYSVVPERPDLNECFTMWHDRLDLIPQSGEIGSLTSALASWRDDAGHLVAATVRHIGQTMGHAGDVPFAAASYLQVNSYGTSTTERDLLQDRHEDGHLITVLHTTAPGLELWVDGRNVPTETAEDEVILMPGSVFERLTGGRLRALDHQVRNMRVPARMAIMYFVNPELSEPIYPWLPADGQELPDLRDEIRSNPAMFGLPHVPVL